MQSIETNFSFFLCQHQLLSFSLDFADKSIQMDHSVHKADVLFAVACSYFMRRRSQLRGALVNLESKRAAVETIIECVALANCCQCELLTASADMKNKKQRDEIGEQWCYKHDYIRTADQR
jgi:hypothetical protein